MQASPEDQLSAPTSESVFELSESFISQLKMSEEPDDSELDEEDTEDLVFKKEADDEEDEKGEEEDDFSFACIVDNAAAIAAEDAFLNGQIRPIFPLFDRDLLLAGGDLEDLEERLPMRPPVKKVFVETEDSQLVTSSSAADDEVSGPYCEWSKKAVEASPEVCKKSNSTGFSKLWRFRDFLNRSNSDGRDAFVFLNNTPPPSTSSTTTTTQALAKEVKLVEKNEASTEKKVAGDVKLKGNVTGGKAQTLKKVKGKGKSATASAVEAYMKSKAQDGDRRKSYLPYRPELVGFFTNINGGLSRNVHPF